jgi:hypothetical protein
LYVLGTVVMFFQIITTFGYYRRENFAYNTFHFNLIPPCIEAGNCLKSAVKFALSLWHIISKMFICLGMTLTNKKFHSQLNQSRLILGNACYNSVQNLLPSHLTSQYVTIKIWKLYYRLYMYGS